MKPLLLLIPTLLMMGCGDTLVSESVLCKKTLPSRTAHAGALLEDGGPKSRQTGLVVLDQMKAGCAE